MGSLRTIAVAAGLVLACAPPAATGGPAPAPSSPASAPARSATPSIATAPVTATPASATPVLVPPAPAAPATPPPPPASAAAPTLAGGDDIFGSVAWNLTPLAGVRVELHDACGPTVVRQTVTDANGMYRFAHVGADGFSVIAFAPSADYWSSSLACPLYASPLPQNVWLQRKLELLAPADGATVEGASVTLSWAPYPDAGTYFVQVVDRATGATVVEQNLRATSYAFVTPTAGRRYDWRVVATGSRCFCGIAGYSWSTFTVVLAR